MDYGRSSESNAITITPDPNSQEIWMAGLNDQALWATEEDYRNWNGDPTPSDAAYDSRHPSLSRSGSEQPPSKKPRGHETNTNGSSSSSSSNGNNNNNGSSNGKSSSSSRAIGKMFFKTKLCCKFRAGTCPYITNCNFAHGIEELRKPPPNWQEIVAAQDADAAGASASGSGPAETREEHQIPILSSSTMPGGDAQRSYKGRHCKKFYTEEGCPYGDMCTFLHDEQSKARESVAISLGPTPGNGGYGAGGGGTAGGANQKPSNWKTRICNKWEMTGYCPFGSKCHFAHGSAELHRYGGGLVDVDGRDSLSAGPDQKQTGTASLKTPADGGASVAHADIYHLPPSQRSVGGVNQRQSQRPLQRWKGPDKISRIYGDWIHDNE